ncbi:MAG: hypothetical protein ACP5IB_06645 [Thermoplasmata archaeon]
MEIKTKKDLKIFLDGVLAIIEKNGGDFRKTEDEIRAFAKKYGVDIYYLTAGVLTLDFRKEIIDFIPNDLPDFIGFSKRKIFVSLVDVT